MKDVILLKKITSNNIARVTLCGLSRHYFLKIKSPNNYWGFNIVWRILTGIGFPVALQAPEPMTLALVAPCSSPAFPSIF